MNSVIYKEMCMLFSPYLLNRQVWLPNDHRSSLPKRNKHELQARVYRNLSHLYIYYTYTTLSIDLSLLSCRTQYVLLWPECHEAHKGKDRSKCSYLFG